jgi:hypothetical protein
MRPTKKFQELLLNFSNEEMKNVIRSKMRSGGVWRGRGLRFGHVWFLPAHANIGLSIIYPWCGMQLTTDLLSNRAAAIKTKPIASRFPRLLSAVNANYYATCFPC